MQEYDEQKWTPYHLTFECVSDWCRAIEILYTHIYARSHLPGIMRQHKPSGLCPSNIKMDGGF